MVPVGLADELLQALPFPVVQVGDGLDVLAVEVGEQALDVVPGVGLLRGRLERVEERLEKGVQAWEDASQEARGDLGVAEQLVQAERANDPKKVRDIASQIVERYSGTAYAALAALDAYLAGLDAKPPPSAAR